MCFPGKKQMRFLDFLPYSEGEDTSRTNVKYDVNKLIQNSRWIDQARKQLKRLFMRLIINFEASN